MQYTLMNGEHEILEFEVNDFDSIRIKRLCCDFYYAPIHFRRYVSCSQLPDNVLQSFLNSRIINIARQDAKDILKAVGVDTPLQLSLQSLGLSLTDHYWYRPYGSELKWKDVSCFDNEYDTSFGEAILRRDYDALAKSDPLTPDSTLGGISRKAWVRIDGAPMLLKSEAGTAKFIEQSELLAARLTERLLDESDYVRYTSCVFGGESYIACRGMVKSGEEFVPAQQILNLMEKKNVESFMVISKDRELLDFFTQTLEKLGVERVTEYYAKLTSAFNLSVAGDCHTNNFGFIRDLDTMKLRCAPLFDRGRSFGSFGQPIEDGSVTAAKYAIESTTTVFVMMLFHSCIIHPEWDFGWYDPKRLEGFEDDIESMISVCEDIPGKYIKMLKAAFQYQLDYLNKAAGKNESTVI